MSSLHVSKMRHGSRLPEVSQDVNPISKLDATSWLVRLDATRGIDTDATAMKTTKRTTAVATANVTAKMTARRRWQNIQGNDSLCEVVRSDVCRYVKQYLCYSRQHSFCADFLYEQYATSRYYSRGRMCRVSKCW